MISATRFLTLILLLASRLVSPPALQPPVVQAILFYTPTCPFCHKVMTEDLPPLLEELGDQLEILAVDIATARGQSVYQAAIVQFQIPDERQGVPTLIVGGELLVGAEEIPERFPGLIQTGLESSGIGYPTLVGFESMADQFPHFTPDGLVGAERESLLERVGRDPLGNGLAVAVLLGMLASLIQVVSRVRAHRNRPRSLRKQFSPEINLELGRWLIPLLATAGLLISGYLTYVATGRAEASCGPVGDCDAVQESQYAWLFGIIPVGLVGVLGFGAILVAWSVTKFGNEESAIRAANLLLPLSIGGTAFSVYLTFLEPFVIGATCSWCLTSAILITALLWLTARPAFARASRSP
jgi:uncharacterized membrane protein/glutaredoxin